MNNYKIKGHGYAIPRNCIHNQDFEKILDTSDEWIQTRTGMQTRYVSDNENTSELAARAAKQAIANAQIDQNEIDLIIVATITPDCLTPSVASLLQARLGLNGNPIMAFDINAACSGFVYALQTASYMLSEYSCALVVGADLNSKIMDYEDRNTCILFGDGAGALILKREENKRQMFHFARSIGDEQGFLKCKGLDLVKPLTNGSREVGFLYQNGSEVFRFAIKAMEEAIVEVLKKANVDISEIDYIIPHQANIRIIRHVAKKMKVADEKFYTNLDKYGNTTGATIPIAFAEAVEKGLIKEKMKIVLVGFGSGFTYAASYLEY